LPLVVTVHDLLPLRHPELFTSETRAHTRLSLPFVRRADRVLTNSEWTRGEVIDLLGLPPERVATTPFGVAERFRPDPAAHDRVRERHGVAGPYVLCVGTREPRKNLVAALRAFERLARRRPDVELVLAGGRGWHGEELERALAAVSDRVRTPGFVSDAELVDLYAAAACFVFPSLAEGFGFPVLEAMACGAPVVTSDNSALREVAGDAALLVDPHSSEAIAEALERVLEDPELRDDLRRRGLERRRAFTWEACADATVAAYRDLLDEHS
jgi:glycosyltransferase involved in cell wall biosynthesis